MKTLETTNHKVNSDGREVKKGKGYVNGEETEITYKINKEQDIFEYVSGVPNKLIGEQLFTWNAVKRLGLQKRLPKYEDFKDFKKDLFPGYWNPNYKKFYTIGKRTDCRLSGGSDVFLGKDAMNLNNDLPEFGFSLRFLKELDHPTIGQLDYLIDRAKENSITVKAYEELKVLLGKKKDDTTRKD